MRALAVPLGAWRARITAPTKDGLTMVGVVTWGFQKAEAAVWREDGSFAILPGLGGNYAAASAVTPDGAVIVGTAAEPSGEHRLVRWIGREIEVLSPDLAYHVGAGEISEDGSVISATAWPLASVEESFAAARWTARAGFEVLRPGPNGEPCVGAGALSGDGRFMIGWMAPWCGKGQHHYAFRWSESKGYELLEPVYRGWRTVAYDVSRDGSVIVGSIDPGFMTYEDYATIWRIGRGMEDLNVLYREIVPSGWTLTFATGVSPDGRYIVGYGWNPSYRTEAWLIDTRGE